MFKFKFSLSCFRDEQKTTMCWVEMEMTLGEFDVMTDQ